MFPPRNCAVTIVTNVTKGCVFLPSGTNTRKKFVRLKNYLYFCSIKRNKRYVHSNFVL